MPLFRRFDFRTGSLTVDDDAISRGRVNFKMSRLGIRFFHSLPFFIISSFFPASSSNRPSHVAPRWKIAKRATRIFLSSYGLLLIRNYRTFPLQPLEFDSSPFPWPESNFISPSTILYFILFSPLF